MFEKMFVNLNVARILAQLMWQRRLAPRKLQQLRVYKLRRLLIQSYQTIGFYRKLMDAAKFSPWAVSGIEDLQRLPVLDRDTYRYHTTRMIRQHPERFQGWFRDATSGSTGQPLPVIRSWPERAYMLAKFLRVLFLNGYRPDDVMLWFASPVHLRPQDTRLQSLGIMKRHVAPFSEPTHRMVERILALRPNVLYANKSHLVQMALYIRQHGIRIQPLKLCISVGEILDSSSCALIESAFGVHGLLDAYGSLELSNIAWRRVAGGGPFEIHHDTDILEVVDESGRKATRGTVLITDLHIRALPLIRYRVGDMMEVSYHNGLPVIQKVIGRTDDLIRLKDGRTCAGPMIEVIMEEFPQVLQYRIIQESYDFIRVIINTESGCDPSALEAAIGNGFRRHIAPDITYQFEFVDNIPPETNGKLRMLISKVRAEPAS